MKTIATKKIALAALAAPVLAAFAIGLAGTAQSQPVGADTGTTTTTGPTANLQQHKDNPTQIPVGRNKDVRPGPKGHEVTTTGGALGFPVL
jgi:hypothetical protein